jgi:hypothetical protein
MPWVMEHCEFAWSTAKLYMTAAKQKANGLAFSTVRGLFPSGRPVEQQQLREPPPLPAAGKAKCYRGSNFGSAPPVPVR